MSQITVIIPVYKVEPYLRRCVDSILGQTFTDFDLILIDDGSPDQCGTLCDEYAAQDQRVHVIHHKENLGLSAARNSGIDWAFEESDSQWISFVDSDDWVHPLYLEALYEAAREYGISASFHIETKDEFPIANNFNTQKTIWKTDDYLLQHSIAATTAWGKLYKKDDLVNIRYPLGRVHEDMFTTHLITNKYKNIPVISPALYFYFINPAGITKSPWTKEKLARMDALEEQISFYTQISKLKLAQARFYSFIDRYYMERQYIQNNPILPTKEKQYLLRFTRKQFQRVLLRYHHYQWISPWRRGKDLWIYSDTFKSIHIIHMIWRKFVRHID